jgi:methylated-DNA-[protein]-cysteine S-methyltransferase
MDASRRFHTIIPSPHGDMLAVVEDGALVRLHWMEPLEAEPVGSRASRAPFRLLERELDDYWNGRMKSFSVPLAPVGTAFQRDVWTALAQIPFGNTTSYSRLAASIGRPRAVRAAGRANGANPIAILIPCHRVIGANGALTGYPGTIERKAALLRLEGLRVSGDSLEHRTVAADS